MAADVARRVSLYGLEFLLPAGWQDWTDYTFKAKSGVLTQLAFAEEPIPVDRVSRWLAHTRSEIAALDGASVLPIRQFKNPEWPAEGFEARFGDAATARYLCCAAVSRSPVVTIRAKGVSGYLKAVETVIATLKKDTPASRRGRYRVFGLSFDCPVTLTNPREFTFASKDGKSRLTCLHVPTQPEWAIPDWSAQFAVSPEASITPQREEEGKMSGAPGVASPQFEVVRTRALAQVHGTPVGPGGAPAPAQRFELFHAQARSPLAGGYLHLELASQAGFSAALTLFTAIITSMRAEP